jgi:uncharacterized protein with HEPN domain
MREPIRDRERLEHILTAIKRIQDNIKDLPLDKLSANVLVYYGIVKNIEIIGEAAYNLTPAFRDSHPETPWRDVMSMRHVLVHDYYMIKESQVRYVIEDNLAPLYEQVKNDIDETDWEQWESNEQAKAESVVHKSLMQSAHRMKRDGMAPQQISRYTGLTVEEIETL